MSGTSENDTLNPSEPFPLLPELRSLRIQVHYSAVPDLLEIQSEPQPPPAADVEADVIGAFLRGTDVWLGVHRALLEPTLASCARTYESSEHRADDLPAYLVIVIVGHIVVPTALVIETNFAPPVWLQLSIYLPFTFFASLALLQPVKGAVVGLQWALHMHGFDENPPDGIPPV